MLITTKHPPLGQDKCVTHLCDLLQKLKLFHIVVPLDSEPIGYWFQTLPHFLWAATNNPLALVTAGKVK